MDTRIDGNTENFIIICDKIQSTNMPEQDKCELILPIILEDKRVLSAQSGIDGLTLLHLAVKRNYIELVKLLLFLGADVNAKDDNNATALHYAAEFGLDQMILCLYYHHIDFNIQNNDMGETALHIAVRNLHPECVQKLLIVKNPIDKSIVNLNEETAEELINRMPDIYSKIKMAEAFGRSNDNINSIPLHVAVNNNQPDVVRSILQLGAPINEADERGYTALHHAAMRGHALIVGLLCLDPKIDMNALDKFGETALHKSVRYEQPQCVKALITARTPIKKSVRNQYACTAEDLVKNIRQLEMKVEIFNCLSSKRTIRNESDSLEIEMIKGRNIGKDLRDELRHLHLKEPTFYIKKSPVSENEATIFRLTNDFSDETRKSTQVYNKKMSIHYDDILNGDLSKIKLHLLSNGDPNLLIPGHNIYLIEAAIRCHSFPIFLELLKHGAKLEVIEENEILENMDIFLKAETQLSSDLNKIKMISDKKIDQESQNMQAIILQRVNHVIATELTVNMHPKKTSSKLDKILADICASNTMDELSAYQDLYFTAAGLLSHYHPFEILASLRDMMPSLTGIEFFTSYVLVKEILLLSKEFGFNLWENPALVASYIDVCKDKDIADILNMIFVYIFELNTNPINTAYIKLRNMVFTHPNPHQEKILDKIQEVVRSDKNIDKIAVYIANELVNLSGRFYQSCSLNEYKNNFNVTDSKFVAGRHLPFQLYLGNSLSSLVHDSILKQKTHEERVRMVSLFILIARECMRNEIIPDLSSVGFIMSAINSSCITRLKLIDSKVMSIYNELQKVISPEKNFITHRDLQTAYVNILPSLVVSAKDFEAISQFEFKGDMIISYGRLYKPFLSLRKMPIYFDQHKSDLIYQLTYNHLLSDDELYFLSFKAKPEIPYLSKNSDFKMIHHILMKQINCNFPLTVKYKKKLYSGEEACNKIKCWLDAMKEKNKSFTDGNNLYLVCEKYLIESKPTESPDVKSSLDGSGSHSFFKAEKSDDKPKKVKRSFTHGHLNTLYKIEEKPSVDLKKSISKTTGGVHKKDQPF